MEMLHVIVDRPIGYIDAFGNHYPINYGYVAGVMGGDGEEQDAYILPKSVTQPLETFKGVLIAVIKRADDVEDKWVISSPGENFSLAEITKAVYFIERHFNSRIILIE